jgi:diaminohydroxyphosphoribosylaminopyrimidine deaminase / 5-amino-6-(5-phosphoribosylamino)uracil reductase
MFTNQNNKNKHNYFMSLAFDQAKRNLGNTRKNPSVGCVITNGTNLFGAGFTSINGRPHAEYNAIKSTKKSLTNSYLYVTLEPCAHYGKTPPCINLIKKKKIKKVFFSIYDPDKRSYKKSINTLKKKLINVKSGFLKKHGNFFYKSYIKSKNNNLPYITCKIATSKDFYTINKKKKWITNFYSRSRVHLMRAEHDCLITSSETILKDNPTLTCRIYGLENKSPARIILDTQLRSPINSIVFKNAKKHKTIVFYNKFNKQKIKTLKKMNVKTIKIELDSEDGKMDLNQCLVKIQSLGYSRAFLECGANLAIKFFNKNLVDVFKLFISNKNINNQGDSNIKKKILPFIRNVRGKKEKINLFGEKLISYKIK